MADSFSYYVHGFVLHSEIECPELLPWAGAAADVTVLSGSLAHLLPDPKHPGRSRSIGERHIFLNFTGIGKFTVRDGSKVIVDPAPGADADLLRSCLLGSVFGCLIHQRGLLPLHANAFLHAGEAVLVMAHSGTGKSTLAAAMKNRGCRILADDVCAVKAEYGKAPVVYPGVPQIKLRQDAATRLGMDTRTLRKVANDEGKYAMPVLEHYCGQSLRIKAMYILNAGDVDELQLREPGRLAKIDALKNYTYRKGMIAKLDSQSAHFQACTVIEQSVRIRRIFRPKQRFLLDELADLIEMDLR